MDIESRSLGKMSQKLQYQKEKDLSGTQWDDLTIVIACVRALEMSYQ